MSTRGRGRRAGSANANFDARGDAGFRAPVADVKIPFSRPTVVGREIEYVRAVLESGLLAPDGSFTERSQEWIRQRTGTAAALLTTSGTSALEMAALLAGIEPGSEVIMPAFTFVSCANAVALRGGTPVFVDVRPDTLNIDPDQVAAAVTPRTRAIIAVHYAGVPCDLAPLEAIAARHGLIVVEDAAAAFLSAYRGRPAGATGHLGIFSFNAQKNVMAGEGGALLVNDKHFLPRAELIRHKGTNRNEFLRRETKFYTWTELGAAFAPSEIMAAVLLAQLEHADAVTQARRQLWSRYHDAFAPLETRGIRRPTVPPDVIHNAHAYHLLLHSPAERDRFIAAMSAHDITTQFHFVPLDTSPAGRRYGRALGSLAVTHGAAGRLVRLPLWHGLEPYQDRVIGRVLCELASSAGST
jgi:dTDP-4-amino-4,6-dideoxygalactose transaminase